MDDAEFLDGHDPQLGSWRLTGDSKDEAALDWLRRQLPPMQDDFVRLRLPRLVDARPGDPAVRSALREADREAKVVDARLFAKVTLQLKGASLDELCIELEKQTRVRLRSSRGVQDEKVTVFVKEKPAREVMRAVARLFGYLWDRQGEEGRYRYTLTQDLRSQLAEGEMRDRDLNAALVALDQAMQAYAPYTELSLEQLQAKYAQAQGRQRERLSRIVGSGWGALQLYRNLSPGDFAELRKGGDLVYGEHSGANRPLPEALKRSILQSTGMRVETVEGLHRLNRTQGTPVWDVPGYSPQVTLRINRAELGQLALEAEVGIRDPHGNVGSSRTILATGKSPSTEKPDNARANAGLRERPHFRREVLLRPQPSCPRFSEGTRTPPSVFSPPASSPPRDLRLDAVARRAHVTSADTWEAVHRATGFPIVADFYTRLHPVEATTLSRSSVFSTLCHVGDQLDARWRLDGEFLLARGTGYYWDKLKEVPNRHLRRWHETRAKEGALPLEQVLELATLTDAQLDSERVGQAVQHCWGIHEWEILGGGQAVTARQRQRDRAHYRLLAALTPPQLRQALSAQGLPVKALLPAQQQEMARVETALLPTTLRAAYVPDGWFSWVSQLPPGETQTTFRFWHEVPVIAARTQEQALAAARAIYPGVHPSQVDRREATLAVWYIDPQGRRILEINKPMVFVPRGQQTGKPPGR